jgi:hypothetical protein
VDDPQPLLLPEREQRLEGRVETEIDSEVDEIFGAHGETRPQGAQILGQRCHRHEAVHGAALEDRDQHLASTRRRQGRASQELRAGAESE